LLLLYFPSFPTRRSSDLVYVNIHSRFVDGFLLKYSQLDETSSIDEIRHPIIREALRLVDISARNLEITSMADIPAGTGLGSSCRDRKSTRLNSSHQIISY